MKRREFIYLIAGAVALPLTAHGQQPTMKRIAVLMGVREDAEGQARNSLFRQTLQASGWTEGKTCQIDVRWSGGDAGRAQAYAAELVSLQPDVILAQAPIALIALAKITKTVPIVFVQVNDPVKEGFVASLSKPGGNVTGFSSLDYTVVGKWVEVLKEIAPLINRVAVIQNPRNPAVEGILQAVRAAASSLSVEVVPVAVRRPGD